MAAIDPFDEHTNRYDAWFERNPFAYRSELQAVQHQFPPGSHRLEIGVGTGRFAAPLGIRIGIDPSRNMHRLARQRGVGVVTGIAEQLPFRNAQFDSALLVTTVCFVDDIAASFLEAHRVLGPSGALIIGFIDRESPLGRTYQRHQRESIFYRSARFYSVAEVVASLKRAGFAQFEISQTLFRPLDDIEAIEPVIPGYGNGSFVVIRAGK